MLLQLTSQALAADVLNAILGSQGSSGSSTGGLISGLIGAFGGRQFGGGVQGGQAVTTGEGGRFGSEIFVPNVSGTVMPATSGAASAAMAPPQVNLTSINTTEKESSPRRPWTRPKLSGHSTTAQATPSC